MKQRTIQVAVNSTLREGVLFIQRNQLALNIDNELLYYAEVSTKQIQHVLAAVAATLRDNTLYIDELELPLQPAHGTHDKGFLLSTVKILRTSKFVNAQTEWFLELTLKRRAGELQLREAGIAVFIDKQSFTVEQIYVQRPKVTYCGSTYDCAVKKFIENAIFIPEV